MTEKKLSERFVIDHNVINSGYAEVTEADIRNALDTLITPEALPEYYTQSNKPPLTMETGGKPVNCHISTYTSIQGGLVLWIGCTMPRQKSPPDKTEYLLSSTRCFWRDDTGAGKLLERKLIEKLTKLENKLTHR